MEQLKTSRTLSMDSEKDQMNLSHDSSSEDTDSKFEKLSSTFVNRCISKTVLIVNKLREIKENESVKSDSSVTESLDWIVNSIINTNIYESEYLKSVESTKTVVSSDYFGYLDELTHKRLKDNDLLMTNTLLSHRRKKSDNEKKSIDQTKMNNYTHEGSWFFNSSKKLSDYEQIVVSQILAKIDTIEFDIFALNELLKNRLLYYIANSIFSIMELDHLLDKTKWKNFLSEIIQGCSRKNKYHNDIHAADVFQTSFLMIYSSNLKEKLNYSDIDIFAFFIAAMTHDFKHPGVDNNYLALVVDPISLRYNDNSPIQNNSISEVFSLIQRNDYDIFCLLTPEEYRQARRRIIDIVLATDLINQFHRIQSVKSKVEFLEIENGNVSKLLVSGDMNKTFENQQDVLKLIIHCSDISNSAKPEHINNIWVELLFKELFNQGDLEKKNNMEVSVLCDRMTVNIEKTQIGFISFIVKPSYDILLNIIPEIEEFYKLITSNLERYKKLSKKEETLKGESIKANNGFVKEKSSTNGEEKTEHNESLKIAESLPEAEETSGNESHTIPPKRKK